LSWCSAVKVLCDIWESFDLQADKYDEWFDSEGKKVFFSEVAALQMIVPVVPRPSLEIGVGTGRFANALGIEIGVDPSPNMLARARDRDIDVVRADGSYLPFSSSSFGGVFLVTTLCFLPDPLAVLREIFRVLRRDGVLFVGFIPAGSNWGRAYIQKGRQGHRLYSVAKFRSVGGMLSLLRSVGFQCEEAVSTLFQPPQAVEEVESPLEGAREDAGFVVLLCKKPAS